MGNTLAYAAAPVPEVAKGVSIPQDKGYVVEEIKDGLYWVTEGAYTAMFLTTGKGVIVVDAPPSFGDKILKAISDVTNEAYYTRHLQPLSCRPYRWRKHVSKNGEIHRAFRNTKTIRKNER